MKFAGWSKVRESTKGAKYSLVTKSLINGYCFYVYDEKVKSWETAFFLYNGDKLLVEEFNVFPKKQEAYSWCIDFMEESSKKLEKRGVV